LPLAAHRHQTQRNPLPDGRRVSLCVERAPAGTRCDGFPYAAGRAWLYDNAGLVAHLARGLRDVVQPCAPHSLVISARVKDALERGDALR